MKKEEEVRRIVKELEQHIMCDKLYGDLRSFPFYGVINTRLAKAQGIRKVLLWVLDEMPRDSIPTKEVNG